MTFDERLAYARRAYERGFDEAYLPKSGSGARDDWRGNSFMDVAYRLGERDGYRKAAYEIVERSGRFA